MVRMKHRDYESDDEIFDDEVFDRRYYPKRVYKDGYGPRVPLYLTDGAMPHAHLLHRPGQVRLSDAQVDVRERALAAKSARVRDAWRGTPMAPDDRDVFELAQRLAPLFHLPQPIATRAPMDADPSAVDPRQAALDRRSAWKKDAWKTRVRR
jgi:hypothetical protein